MLVEEPLRGIVDAGDVKRLSAYYELHKEVDLAQPYDDFQNPSLLHRCVDLGHVEMTRFILSVFGPKAATVPGLHGATLMHLAARRGCLEVLRMLMPMTPAFINATDTLGWAPLHDAAMEGRREAVEYLLRRRSVIPCK